MPGNEEFDAWAAANVAPTNDGPKVPESIRINSEIERTRLTLHDALVANDSQAIRDAAKRLDDLMKALVSAIRSEKDGVVVVNDPRMESTRMPQVPPYGPDQGRILDREHPIAKATRETVEVGPVRTKAIEDVDRERRRQIAKGFNAESDDQCMQGELVFAAASFALRGIKDGSDTALFASIGLAPLRAERNFGWVGAGGLFWPWAKEFPWGNDRRTRLIKAAALLVAEIERLDRKKES
jgi:hypothetical protein